MENDDAHLSHRQHNLMEEESESSSSSSSSSVPEFSHQFLYQVAMIEAYLRSNNMNTLFIASDCHVFINDSDIMRHDMWLPLEDIKPGRLHLATKVTEGVEKVFEQSCEDATLKGELKKVNLSVKLHEKSKNLGADSFQPINVECQTRPAYGFITQVKM